MRCAIPWLLLLCAGPALAGEDGGEAARGARIREPAFAETEVIASESGFRLRLIREMPTPGWTFHIDGVERENGRITVRATEVRPQGLVAQVLSKARMEVPLGALEPATYFVEIRLRRDPSGEHVPVQAVVLQAYR